MSNAAEIVLATARPFPVPSFLNLTVVAVTAVVIAAALSPGVDLAVASMFYLGDRQFLGEGVKTVQLLRLILMSVYAGACIGVVAGLIAARMNRGVWLSLTFSQCAMKIAAKMTSDRKCAPCNMRIRPARPPAARPAAASARQRRRQTLAAAKNTTNIDEASPLTKEQLRRH